MDSSEKKGNPTGVLQNGENFAKEEVMQNGELMQNTCRVSFKIRNLIIICQ